MNVAVGEIHGGTFRLPVRVYYEDTDAGGVVYYANYLKFLERARTEWLRAVGWDQSALAGTANLLFAVRALELDYLAPARLDDWLEVEARLARTGRASLDFEQRVCRGNTELCCGHVRVVCIDAMTFRPRALPAELMEVFAGDH